MTLDQVENFVRVSVAGTHDSGASTVALESGEASELPSVTDGKYNLVWFDASGFAQPDADPNVEIVRVNSINTNNDTISVTRGVENTSATAKDTGTNYELLLTPTAKIIEDIDANKLDTTQRYTDSEAVSAIDDEVIEPDKSIHDRSISGDITLESDDGLVLSGTVTGTGSISGDGSFSVAGGSTNVQIPDNVLRKTDSIDATTLEGVNSSGFVKTSDPIDADTLDGKDSTDFVETIDNIDADTLDGKDSTDFVETSASIDADTLDGKDSTDFIETSDTIDADTLDGKTASELGGSSTVFPGAIDISSTGNFTVSSVPFRPSSVKFEIQSNGGQNRSTATGGGSNVQNSASKMTGFARDDGTRQAIGNAASGDSINEVRKFSSNNKCILMEYSGNNGQFEGSFEGDITSFDSDGFTLNMSSVDEREVVIFTAYK